MQPLASMEALDSSGDARRWVQCCSCGASLQLWLSSTANKHCSHCLHSKTIRERLKNHNNAQGWPQWESIGMDNVCFLLFCLSFLFCWFGVLFLFFMCLFYVTPLFSCNEPENHSDIQGAAQEYEHSVDSLQNLASLQISSFGSLNPRTDSPSSRKYLVYKHACILILSAAYLRSMGEIVYRMWCALKWVPTKVIEVTSTIWDTVISNPRMSWCCQLQMKLFVLNSESPWNAEQYYFKSPNMCVALISGLTWWTIVKYLTSNKLLQNAYSIHHPNNLQFNKTKKHYHSLIIWYFLYSWADDLNSLIFWEDNYFTEKQYLFRALR